MYSRNYLYVSKEQQDAMANTTILIAGVGLGSNIAECAVRLGFKNLILIDGDRVELSNLNRQNFVRKDIGKYKVHVVKKRIESINPEANISVFNEFITEENAHKFMKNCTLVINTIDFESNAPFLLDKLCIEKGITALHPYNLGWGAFTFIINKDSKDLSWISEDYKDFELKIASHFIQTEEKKEINCEWIKNMIEKYKPLIDIQSPPQLSIGAYLIAAMCCDIMCKIINKESIKLFPDLYFLKL